MKHDSDEENHECRYCYPISLRLLMKCFQCVTCYYFWDDHSLSRLIKKCSYKENNLIWNLIGAVSGELDVFFFKCFCQTLEGLERYITQ
ncbi:hypothetical protein Y032_0005g2592 [Ancylostoma ceylanicum]|uniref:Uncharacterized protein n=1 Tax=Ancylostoma ceylanicum TaxID=53326 RepID=A0A016VSF2_9BILA|nr:hypothetical protein Y032_0005g2592 [Ancylostoma ceylanicum]